MAASLGSSASPAASSSVCKQRASARHALHALNSWLLPPNDTAVAPSASHLGSKVQASPRTARASGRRQRVVTNAGVPSFMSLPSVEGYTEVQGVKGIRLVLAEGDQPTAEYLVQWKDGSDDTWEVAGNLSSDLIRDFETRWWNAARKAEFDTLAEMLAGGREVLAQAVDENRRSALHFAAALGKSECVRLLLEAGADPNLQDTQGYTPLHMAAGYMHTSSMTALLAGGSDPQLKDASGKDVVSLIENIRTTMPLNLGTVMQRLRLEEVANCLTDMLYEEIPARAILAERRTTDGSSREFLVAWADGREDSWVLERDVSDSLLEDYAAGMEAAPAQAILDMVQVGTERKFKIRWEDEAYPDSWEPEEHVPQELIAAFAAQNPGLFEQRVAAAGTRAALQASRMTLDAAPEAAPVLVSALAPDGAVDATGGQAPLLAGSKA